MRPRKKGQQYEICYRCPGYNMNAFLPMKPQICGSLKSNTRSLSANFDRQNKRLYKPNARPAAQCAESGGYLGVYPQQSRPPCDAAQYQPQERAVWSAGEAQ